MSDADIVKRTDHFPTRDPLVEFSPEARRQVNACKAQTSPASCASYGCRHRASDVPAIFVGHLQERTINPLISPAFGSFAP